MNRKENAANEENAILEIIGNMSVNEICDLSEAFTARHTAKQRKALLKMPIIERARYALKCQRAGYLKSPVNVW